jgi:hypothetical protein
MISIVEKGATAIKAAEAAWVAGNRVTAKASARAVFADLLALENSNYGQTNVDKVAVSLAWASAGLAAMEIAVVIDPTLRPLPATLDGPAAVGQLDRDLATARGNTATVEARGLLTCP